MSLNDIINPPGNETWKSFYVNDFNVSDTLSVNNIDISGTIISTGNISITNASPGLYIINNGNNVNRATLQLVGNSALSVSPTNLQQGQDGTFILENFSSKDINLISHSSGNITLNNSGTGRVKLTGTNYPTPSSTVGLGLNTSNQIVELSSVVSSNFTVNWTGPVTVSTSAKAVLNNGVVTITFPTSLATGNNTSSNMLSQAGAIPVAFRNSATIYYPIQIVNNTASQIGTLQITASGVMGIYKADGTPFDASVATIGFNGIGFSYVQF
jgi:hypothetical protein